MQVIFLTWLFREENLQKESRKKVNDVKEDGG